MNRALMNRLLAGIALSLLAGAAFGKTIKIGLVTALSGQSARAGEAITRGLTVAIDEINAKGGVLGRKLELVRRDDEATPAKGVIAARELLYKEKVTVLFGGLDTPVSIAIVPIVNEAKVPFMGPWAAGTPITRNGANPNFVFRVSAVDEIVDKAMLQYSQKAFNAKNCGMILVNNPWGESNEKGLSAALSAQGMKPAGGVANAYDGMMLTAMAIQAAGSTDGPKIREGFYKIGKYEGLIKTYAKPFTSDNHDAVNENDYVWTQFIDNQILPVGMKK